MLDLTNIFLYVTLRLALTNLILPTFLKGPTVKKLFALLAVLLVATFVSGCSFDSGAYVVSTPSTSQIFVKVERVVSGENVVAYFLVAGAERKTELGSDRLILKAPVYSADYIWGNVSPHDKQPLGLLIETGSIVITLLPGADYNVEISDLTRK